MQLGILPVRNLQVTVSMVFPVYLAKPENVYKLALCVVCGTECEFLLRSFGQVTVSAWLDSCPCIHRSKNCSGTGGWSSGEWSS